MTAQEAKNETETLIETLVGLGTLWARYGLTLGRNALETSAKTLSTTAEILAEVSKKFEQAPAQPKV